MPNASLKYLDRQRWVNGVEKTRADSQLEFVDTLSSVAAGLNGSALASGSVRIAGPTKPVEAPACKSVDN